MQQIMYCCRLVSIDIENSWLEEVHGSCLVRCGDSVMLKGMCNTNISEISRLIATVLQIDFGENLDSQLYPSHEETSIFTMKLIGYLFISISNRRIEKPCSLLLLVATTVLLSPSPPSFWAVAGLLGVALTGMSVCALCRA